MTYTELVAAIKSYTENDYSTTDVNTFIQNAEQRIHNTVQLPDLRKNVTGTMSLGNKYFSLPSDWLSTFSIAVINSDNEYTYLLNKDVNFVRESFPDTDSGFYGKPEYYGIFDDNTMILGPTPDANYSAELHYYYYPQTIVTAGNTWLGDNFDTALFYGALLEAAAFMKEDADTVTQYTARYSEVMQLLKNLGDGKNRRDAYRSGQERIPVRNG
jgi:hypothetical protein|tara:strand:- start:1647 stop:2288 length:642 start_codon:yes stop_codon:yes gene_type:complete